MSALINILKKLNEFRDDRNWKQFHTAENLAKSICIEASELLENYQWGDTPVDRENLKDEVADIFCYLLMFCQANEIDLIKETFKKIKKNQKKYPKDKVYGSSKKYNQYDF